MNRIKPLALILAPMLLLSFGSAAAQDKVGVFNAQAISENTEIGKKIQEELNKFTESKEADITTRQSELQGLQQQRLADDLLLQATLSPLSDPC